MTTFADLTFKLKHDNVKLGRLSRIVPEIASYPPKQARIDFQNGYGASVIAGWGAYGYERGLYELAVFHFGRLCYASPITSDVIGRLTDADVTGLLKHIENLKPFAACSHISPRVAEAATELEKVIAEVRAAMDEAARGTK